MSDSGLVFKTLRPNFLPLTISCFLLSLGMAVWSDGAISGVRAVLALVAALAAHISINGLNEYADFRSGLDGRTKKSPFNGGSGVLPTRPDLALKTLHTSVVALFVASGIGAWFSWILGSMPLLLSGMIGVTIIVAYTPWLTHRPFLCLVAPGFGFGILMTGGTYYVLAGHIGIMALLASLVPFFLVSNLLLLNQLPDREADITVGRAHFPIVFGERKSLWVYAGFASCAALVIVFGVYEKMFPMWTGVGVLAIAPAVFVVQGMAKPVGEGRLLFALGMNVAITLITPVLMAIGFVLSR